MYVLAKLLLLFTIIPIIELSLLTLMSTYVGLPYTLALIVLTAIGGAILGKAQGTSAWKRINEEISTGKLPENSILDGLAVLVASAFLITPGVLTDIVGFSLLIPTTRAPIKMLIRRRIKKWIESPQGASSNIYTYSASFYPDDEDLATSAEKTFFDGTPTSEDKVIIDVTPEHNSPSSKESEQNAHKLGQPY